MLLVTGDMDFCNVLAYPPPTHNGVVVLRIDPENEPQVHMVLLRLLADHPPPSPAGTLVVVTSHKYRLRCS